MTRLPDWQLRFDAALTERRREPFTWTANNCTLFAADMVMAITGHDPAAGQRGLSALQSMREVKRSGGLIALATATLGPPVDMLQARQGDIVLADLGGVDGFAVCIDATTAVTPSRAGLWAIPMSGARCCWRVG